MANPKPQAGLVQLERAVNTERERGKGVRDAEKFSFSGELGFKKIPCFNSASPAQRDGPDGSPKIFRWPLEVWRFVEMWKKKEGP